MSLKADIYRLGVNVMACAGFGRRIDWTDDGKAAPTGHSISLLDAIMGIVLYLPYILLLPKWLLKRSPWKVAYTAYTEFELYMREFIAEESGKINAGKEGGDGGKTKGNLLTVLLATSKAEEKDEAIGGQRSSFTVEEVLGNIFMFFMAGEIILVSFLPFGTPLLRDEWNVFADRERGVTGKRIQLTDLICTCIRLRHHSQHHHLLLRRPQPR